MTSPCPQEQHQSMPAIAARGLAFASEAVALRAESSPLSAASPYHAFARCPPTCLFGRPRLWPGREASATTARLLWDDSALYVCWELEGAAAPPVKGDRVAEGYLESLQGGAVRPEQRSVLLDERVECFLWQPPEAQQPLVDEKRGSSELDRLCAGQVYHAFEINYGGRVLTNRARFGGPMGFDWASEGACAVWTDTMTVGWGSSSSPVPSQVDGLAVAAKRVVVAEIRWGALGIETGGREIRIGLHRAEHREPLAGDAALGQKEAERLMSELVWSSWVDPGDDEVNFHRPALFGKLMLTPVGADIDCSCGAARLWSSRDLRVLRSPRPSLSECPEGALVVRGKYASLCGSDLPYFRDMASKGASCYWDRDGFCGHEVIGVVIGSKSAHFQRGDTVMSLPSSYFKAHAGSKQEWYREEVHGVLLQNFPVRGGFCQIYTSHALYSYKIKECVPRMLLAQGLGTLLRMARRLGPVLGKTVAVMGQGQNGLMATRLMAQMCAKHVIAIETVEHRRALALTMGATEAVTPEDAPSAIAAVTSGRGADVVLEMVGHNQDTINVALELVACAGTVVAFGVPDDRVYSRFEYSTFFRKNVSLIASVIPDPGTDFPEAVALIEQGRFSTEGILTHTVPLSEVQRAFTMASEYTEGVVKVVVELG